ncbi:MAG: ion transporter [Proteobacteria bacterium]|nr:ion transporter [Pseudomonadota bacterium]
MTHTTKLQAILVGRPFNLIVLWLIFINAIVIGLETSSELMQTVGIELKLIENTIIGLFVLEISVRIMAFRGEFFKKGWNIFDFLVIGASLFPHAAGLSILRTFRVIHSLHMFELSPYMRHLLQALRHVGPSVVNVTFLMVIAFYVLGVVGVELFSEHFPRQFGSLPWSLLTLFQLMVYDEYGMITRPILEVYPFAWIYFLSITFILAFVLINLFIAIVVTALQRAIAAEKDPIEAKVTKEMKMLVIDEQTINALRGEIQELKEMVRGLKEK